VKMTHPPYSPFVGQKAVFEADPQNVKEIQEEFKSPPMDYALFHSPHLGKKKSPKTVQQAITPRYIAGGLLEGGLLPPTTYQPPPQTSEKVKPKKEVIYSPSMYSVATGNDVFNVSSFLLCLVFFMLCCFADLVCTFLSSTPSPHLHLLPLFCTPIESTALPPLHLGRLYIFSIFLHILEHLLSLQILLHPSSPAFPLLFHPFLLHPLNLATLFDHHN
jgi:hypothetical protein